MNERTLTLAHTDLQDRHFWNLIGDFFFKIVIKVFVNLCLIDIDHMYYQQFGIFAKIKIFISSKSDVMQGGTGSALL